MTLTRGGAAVTALSAASAAWLGPDAGRRTGEMVGPSFPDALLAIGSLVQLTMSVWILFTVLITALGPTTRLARVVSPRVVRGALFAGAAGVLTITPAHADRVVPLEHVVSGLRLPDRPAVAASDPPAAARPVAGVDLNGRAAAGTVIVRPGDTLWAIAARFLPPDASDAEIARACDRWYATNRDVIGTDADVIFPDQRLEPPTMKDRS